MRLPTLCGFFLIMAGHELWAGPDPLPDPNRVRALVRQLDHPRYALRSKADRQLRLLGEAALPLLRRELDRAGSLEVYRRLERIIRYLGMAEEVRARVVDLDSNYYSVRDQADRALRGFGKPILPQLKKALARATDPGVRAHLIDIIKDLSRGKGDKVTR